MTIQMSDCEGCILDSSSGCIHDIAWERYFCGDTIIKCKHRQESMDVPFYADDQETLSLNMQETGKIVVSIGDEKVTITRDQAYTMSKWLIRMANRHSSEEVEL